MGTVGRWVLDALRRNAGRPPLQLVAAADSRSGLVHRPEGFRIHELLDAKATGSSLADLERIQRWPTVAEGLRAVDIDILVEVTQSPADGEPGLTHMRDALRRGVAVATSNKWPVAVGGTELVELARESGTEFRAESTVMSGTPVLSSLTEGISGTTPRLLRGVVNATVNFICSQVEAGKTYERALEMAREIGLAERDPSADVDGHDSVAKVMVLAALVFGIKLSANDVERRGLSELQPRPGDHVREVVTLDPEADRFTVEARPISHDDPLSRFDGATNAIIAQVDPIGEITIAGPGAGRELAGQGVYSDLLRLAAGVASG
jgi:homoserine dehydrogenase